MPHDHSPFTSMIRAAVLGASGYSGAELIRILSSRSDVSIVKAMAASAAGKALEELYPAFSGTCAIVLDPPDPGSLRDVDVVFCALPSGESMKTMPDLLDHVGKVIDLSGDFRIPRADVYEKFYKHEHTASNLLSLAAYGLPEVNGESIAHARLVANPGCYPTSAILALLPAVLSGLVSPGGIVINSLSGTSGAGRSASLDMSFAEVNENIRAYKVGSHQHIPEIEHALGFFSGNDVSVSFVPHLVPLTRGIYTTVHATLERTTNVQEVLELYGDFYHAAPWVRIRRQVPQIRDVLYTNYCDIGVAVEPRTGQLILLSVIDNLVKGAAGQAIQNMNIMFGLPEDQGCC